MIRLKLAAVVVLLVAPICSNAVVIWDESVDGDLQTGLPPAATDIPAVPGSFGASTTWQILGSLNTSTGSDESDVMKFTADVAWTLYLDFLIPETMDRIVISVWDATSSMLLNRGFAAAPAAQPYAMTFAPGTYYIRGLLAPATFVGSLTYGISIVPAPPVAALVLAGLVLLSFMLRSRNRSRLLVS